VGGTTVFSSSSNRLVLKAPYLGRSYLTDRTVTDILFDALPGTLILALVAMFFAMIVGISLGVWSALREGSFIDRSILLLASVGMSGPSFFMAIVIAWIGGYLLHDSISISLWIIVLPLFGFVLQKFLLKRKRQHGFPGFTGAFICPLDLWRKARNSNFEYEFARNRTFNERQFIYGRCLGR